MKFEIPDSCTGIVNVVGDDRDRSRLLFILFDKTVNGMDTDLDFETPSVKTAYTAIMAEMGRISKRRETFRKSWANKHQKGGADVELNTGSTLRERKVKEKASSPHTPYYKEKEEYNKNATKERETTSGVLSSTGSMLSPHLSASDFEGLFSEFWSEYPRKDSKKVAHDKYRLLMRDAGKSYPRLHATILSAVRIFKGSDQWKRNGGKFIPMPSTFLNQERWNDEAAATAVKKASKFDALEAMAKRMLGE